jgi:hypothetical protein
MIEKPYQPLTPESEATLFAAAPDLYEALEALLPMIDCVDGLTKVEWRPEAAKARAALAKARGEQSDAKDR